MNLARAKRAIEDGQIVGIPTDTVYGLAIDPLDPEAVDRLFTAKGRPEGKPVGLLAANMDQVEEVAHLGEAAGELARQHWPGGLTLIVAPKVVLSNWVGDRQRRSIGIRIPDHPVALEFLAMTGPLAVTSANRSGGAEVMNDEAALAIFGDEVAFYIEGVSPGGVASTVVDATGYQLTVLRQGAITLPG